MQVDLLCSGSKGNSCLIRTKNSSLLIDCGSTKKYLMNALGSVNQRVDDLNALLVTHAHTDHVSQLKHFRHLPVYSYCDLKDLDNHRIVRPLQEFDINEFHIQVISLSHDSPNTVGYVIYADGKKLVYVTDTGVVYHKNPHCTHLDLSIHAAASSELNSLRNESGGKYHACEKCVHGSSMGGSVYITDQGDRYHNSLTCSGLKRTVYTARISEVPGKRACSKCGGK